MINSVFFISDTAFQPGDSLPAVDNIYFSILVNPLEKVVLEGTYKLMSDSKAPFSLALDIAALPDTDSIRFITSFLFLPSYLHINHQPVINLVGTSEEMMKQTIVELNRYFLSQGFNNPTINIVRKSTVQEKPGGYRLFTSKEELIEYHESIFQKDEYYNQQLFFYGQTTDIMNASIAMLMKSEDAFKTKSPRLYQIAKANQALTKEVNELTERLGSVQAELSYQQEHNNILRSEHSTKKLQDYYNQEYEVLPTWYKRLGHIVKVITGKRKFRSLFNDGVKKKRD
jgi:regulator of replication initiation timing